MRSSSSASVFGLQEIANSPRKQSSFYPSIPNSKDEFAERVAVVRKTFQLGVPKFNSGKYDVSRQTYSSAVIKLMPGLKGFPQGRMLFRALALSRAQQDCYASWYPFPSPSFILQSLTPFTGLSSWRWMPLWIRRSQGGTPSTLRAALAVIVWM